jgi:hypothetical protein
VSKLSTWFKAWRWYVVAYVVFIVLFWFVGTPSMTKAEAYFGLVGLHLVFAGGVWVARNILRG